MDYSTYQNKVFDAVLETNDNLIINAVAGSGKTTTIIEAMNRIPEKRTLFVAFNKHIATELEAKVPMSAEARTLHSIGMQVYRKQHKCKVDGNKVSNIVKFELFDLNKQKKECFKVLFPIVKLVGLYKSAGLVPCEIGKTTVEEFIEEHDIHLAKETSIHEIHMLSKEALRLNNISEYKIDFDDMIYFPVIKDMDFPCYDIVFVDESQDMNPIQIDFLEKFKCRIIAVGDRHQAIYGFRGADTKAMDSMISRFNMTELPLSICYRCPQRVVDLAKEIVPHIECGIDKLGNVQAIPLQEFDSGYAESGDYVLCRTTAPMVSSAFSYIRNGRKATIKGRDIGKNLLDLHNEIWKSIGDYRDSVSSWLSEKELVLKHREGKLIMCRDQAETLLCILDHCEQDPQKIAFQIEKIFTDNVEGIVFCTIHKAKGLEAKNIFILNPELLPHPMAKRDWQIEQEMNLKYVAITRSLDTLTWVTA